MKTGPGKTYARLSQLMTEARKKSGLSQQEVADRLGRPQTYVSRVERGTRQMDLVEFLEVAEAIGFDPAEFIEQLKSD
jgi:transcriptional regulator with XRE-family HTH domain